MVGYWIFVSVPFSDFNAGTLSETLKRKRTTEKWLIGTRTPSRSRISIGDKVLFYQGGEDGRKIVASAELASDLQEDEDLGSFVEIKSLRIWENPLNVKALIDKLSFIKNQKYWGAYFQGGIIKITEEDYKKIRRKAGRLH